MIQQQVFTLSVAIVSTLLKGFGRRRMKGMPRPPGAESSSFSKRLAGCSASGDTGTSLILAGRTFSSRYFSNQFLYSFSTSRCGQQYNHTNNQQISLIIVQNAARYQQRKTVLFEIEFRERPCQLLSESEARRLRRRGAAQAHAEADLNSTWELHVLSSLLRGFG